MVGKDRRLLHSCCTYSSGSISSDNEEGDVCSVICHKGIRCQECLIDRAFSDGRCAAEQRQVDGGIVNIRVWPIKIQENDIEFAVIFWQDITSQKNLEAQLFHSQKLEAIGELAAGVAHEINNPLGYIYGNLKTMKEYVNAIKKLLDISGRMTTCSQSEFESVRSELVKLNELEDLQGISDDVESLLNECLSGAVRVTEIVSNLKSFARPDSKDKKDYNLNEGLQSTLKILNNEIKYKCEVREEYGPISEIECHPGEINQVFINIIANAVHAISDHGLISIRTWQEAEEIFIEIQDNGSGISQENLAHIFDPFFTTKPVGKGTGLGLSVSHGIVEKHQGHIQVKSQVGEGSTFTIVLPVRSRQE